MYALACLPYTRSRQIDIYAHSPQGHIRAIYARMTSMRVRAYDWKTSARKWHAPAQLAYRKKLICELTTFRATHEHSTSSPIGISHLASQVGVSHHYTRSHISPPELTSSRGHSDSICDCHFIRLPPETKATNPSCSQRHL